MGTPDNQEKPLLKETTALDQHSLESSSVHFAMSRAQQYRRRAHLDTSGEDKFVIANFKLLPEEKEHAQRICAQHGVKLSRFLRFCCIQLIEGYIPNFDADEALFQESLETQEPQAQV